jgi:dynein intermediate chain
MADAARSQRAAALEEKKRKLEEIKARRNRRIAGSDDVVTARALASSNLEEDIDRLLQTPPITTALSEGGEVNEAESTTTVQNGDDRHRLAADDERLDNVVAEPAPAPPPARPIVESFTAATQTEEEDFLLVEHEEEEPTPEEKETVTDGAASSALPHDTEHVAGNLAQPKVMSTEEVEEELVSSDFSFFINNASKKVERVLGAANVADFFVDYVGELDGVERPSAKSDASRFLSSRQVYECAKWTQTRDVTDLDWSPLHRELMLSSYHMPTSPGLSSLSSHSSHSAAVKSVSGYDTPSASLAPRSGELQSDGLALVWSLFMPTRPEHIFTCGSPVLTTRFHPTEAPLVIGGCQSGQLVVWDVRAGRLPVQRSSSSVSGSKGHIHPVCSMEVVESGVSVSMHEWNRSVARVFHNFFLSIDGPCHRFD